MPIPYTDNRMTDLRWKLIETYERPRYAGYTDLVLLGWDMGDPNGVVMFFAVGWKDQFQDRWIDSSDKKPWPDNSKPTHWLCSLRKTFPQDYRTAYADAATG